jgi:hypothetical protein
MLENIRILNSNDQNIINFKSKPVTVGTSQEEGSEDKIDDVKDSFYDELERVFDNFRNTI